MTTAGNAYLLRLLFRGVLGVDDKSFAEKQIPELEEAVLPSTEETFGPQDFPIKLKPPELSRVVAVDETTKRTFFGSFLGIPSAISSRLPPSLTEISSMDELNNLLKSADFDPTKCKKITVKYFSTPKTLRVLQGSTANMKVFYGDTPL